LPKYLCFFWIFLLNVEADIISSSAQTNIAQATNDFTISGGDISGSNVVFSFSDFNIDKIQSATFVDGGFINSIARVTGENISTLDGTLKSSAENFYFLNPNGVIIGENVQLDLAGSFHLSTANFLELEDGKRIYAKGETLDFTTSNPESFGFLEDSKFAPVTIESAVNSDNPTGLLGIMNGDFNIVAGDVIFEEGTIPTTSKISILDIQSNKTLQADGDQFWGLDSSFNQYYIDIATDQLFVYNSKTNSYIYDKDVVENVDYKVQAAVAMLHTESDPLTNELISTQTVRESETYEAYDTYIPILDSNGNTIPIYKMLANVVAPTIYMNNGDLTISTIKSEGIINLSNHSSTADSMGDITLSSTYINGMGNMLFQANNINLDASNIVNFSSSSLVPDNVSFQAKDSINFTNGSSIISNISSGSGAASTINLVSGNLISFSGSNPLTKEGSFLFSNSSLDDSHSANIYLNSKNIELKDGTKITSTGYNNADSGSIILNATNNIEISGMDDLKAVSAIVTGTDWGKNGDISLTANSMLMDKGNILSSVYKDGKQLAGDIIIDIEDTLTFKGDADERISSNPNERTSSFAYASIYAVNYSSTKGPNLYITAKDVVMDQFILSQTSGPNLFTPYQSGAVGDLSIVAENIKLSNGNMFNSNNGYTSAGVLDIDAIDISLDNMNLFSKSHNDKAEAGTYSIGSDKTQDIYLSDTLISTESTEADGGGITLKANGTTSLSSSSLITKVEGGVGGGGNINVVGAEMGSFNSSELNANAYGGAGGNLLIEADNILKSKHSIFTASSELGVNGNIDFSGNLIEENIIVNQVNYGLLKMTEWSSLRCDANNKSTLVIEFSDMYEQKCADLNYINVLETKDEDYE